MLNTARIDSVLFSAEYPQGYSCCPPRFVTPHLNLRSDLPEKTVHMDDMQAQCKNPTDLLTTQYSALEVAAARGYVPQYSGFEGTGDVRIVSQIVSVGWSMRGSCASEEIPVVEGCSYCRSRIHFEFCRFHVKLKGEIDE